MEEGRHRKLYRQTSVLWTQHIFQLFFLTIINLSAFPFQVPRINWNFRRCSFSCKKYLINKVYSPTFSWFLPLITNFVQIKRSLLHKYTPVHPLRTPDKQLQQLTSDTAYHMLILTSPLQQQQFHSDLEYTVMLPDVDCRFKSLKLPGNCNIFLNQLLFTTTVYTKSHTNFCPEPFPYQLMPSQPTEILNTSAEWFQSISYNEWLKSSYSYSALLIKSLSRWEEHSTDSLKMPSMYAEKRGSRN
jgi:hypothetical protein